ncbi:MAG: NAD-dependent epimerase/dehydratase family protein, partial [Acidimicrobiia bacterium]
YGLSKMAAGEYLRYYAEAHDLDTTVLALANVYGPRQDPHGEAGVVAIFAGRLLAGEPCVVYGDGNQTRDFVYVDDVVDAFMRAAGATSVALGNVGTGTETSVNQLHSLMSDLVGNARPALPAPARVGELARSALDPSYLGRALGWKPSVSLEEGLRRTLDWFRQRR